MLNDDLADRTLPPTERRRREAKSRGEVARSPELTAAVVLLALSCGLWFFSPTLVNSLSMLMRSSLSAPPTTSMDVSSGVESIRGAVRVMASILAPVIVMLLLAGFAANVIQTGWLWNPATVSPRVRTGSILSWGRIGAALGRLVQLACLGLVTWRFLMTHHWRLRSVGLNQPDALIVQPARLLGELCFQLSLALLLFALIDYGVRFWRHEQRLKMTVEERRREQQEETANPQIKRQQAAARGQQSSVRSTSEIQPIEPTGHQ